MKSSFKLIIACLAAGVLLASCAKENLAPAGPEAAKGNVVTLTVKADLPEPEGDPQSKLTLDNSTMKMEWDGGETLLVFAGKVVRNKADDADSLIQKTIKLTGGTGDEKGVFTGALDFGDTGLTVDDIQAIALNGSTSTTANVLELSSGKMRILMTNDQVITQSVDNFFDGKYAAPYAFVSASNITEDSGNYTISGVSLKYARPVLKFYVYDSSGAHAAHKLKKVLVTRTSTLGGTYMHGNTIINSNGTISNSGTTYTGAGVTFSADNTIPTSKADALQLYFALHRPRTNYNIAIARITYNDGTEDKTIDKEIKSVLGSLNLQAGKVYKISIDLADNANLIEYSTDGGATWDTTLPAAAFSTLAVRKVTTASPTYTVSGSVLAKIKTTIDTYGDDTNGVDLDLSGINVTSGTLTAVFSGAPIKSVKLPANTTVLSDNCFKNCDKLASVDLTGISGLEIGESAFYGCTALTSFDFSKVKTIGSYSFCNAPITEVDLSTAQPGTLVKSLAFVDEITRTVSSTDPTIVPNPTSNTSIKTVKLNNNVELEIYAFMRLTALEYVYYDVPNCTKNAFGWQTGNWVTPYTHHNDLTAVIGPHVTATNMIFWTNANLSKVIIEDGATGFGNNTFACCRYLKEIECRATTALPTITTTTFRYYTGSNASRSTGYNVDAAEKKLLVPAASATLYDETNGGLWYTTVQQNLGYTLTTY